MRMGKRNWALWKSNGCYYILFYGLRVLAPGESN